MTPVAVVILAGAVLAVLAARTDGGGQAAVNGALGLAALFAVHLTSAYTGLRLGFNLFNAAVAGVLGVPGVALLALVQWLFA